MRSAVGLPPEETTQSVDLEVPGEAKPGAGVRCRSPRAPTSSSPRVGRHHYARLQAYGWPGNVRELKNVIERASILACGGELRLDLALPALGSEAGDVGRPASPRAGSGDPTREAIEATLARHDGVVARAASELGISRQKLYRLMSKLGITPGSAG